MNEHNKYANTSMIEDYVYSVLYPAVSSHVFVGTLPTAVDNTWGDMVLIDCDLPINDYGCYSKGTVYVFLYARPKADGTKNAPKLASMENDVCDVLDNSKSSQFVYHNPHYSIERVGSGGDYDTVVGWHRNFIHLNITITD